MRKLIKIPIWNRKILVVTPPHDILKSSRFFKMGRNLIGQVKSEAPIENELACVYFCDDSGKYILWFKNRKPSIDTLIHETNHIVKHMMKFIGAGGEKEANAYTQEFIFNEVRKALRITTPK